MPRSLRTIARAGLYSWIVPEGSVTHSVSSPLSREELLNLHRAEYAALMARCTSFISMHVGMWSAIVAVAAFFFTQWSNTQNATYVWLGGLAVQAFLHIWVTLVEEQYLAASYIENVLRRAVLAAAPGLKAQEFWQYETSVAKRRIPESWWGEWLLPVILLAALIAACMWRHASLLRELPGVIVNGTSLAALAVRTQWRISLRKSFMRQNA